MSVSSMYSYFFSLQVFPKCKAIAGMKANAENTEMVTIATAPVSNLHGDWNIQHPGDGLLSEELTVLSEKGSIPHHQASTSLTAPKSSPYFGQLHTHTRVHAHTHTCTRTHTHGPRGNTVTGTTTQTGRENLTDSDKGFSGLWAGHTWHLLPRKVVAAGNGRGAWG